MSFIPSTDSCSKSRYFGSVIELFPSNRSLTSRSTGSIDSVGQDSLVKRDVCGKIVERLEGFSGTDNLEKCPWTSDDAPKSYGAALRSELTRRSVDPLDNRTAWIRTWYLLPVGIPSVGPSPEDVQISDLGQPSSANSFGPDGESFSCNLSARCEWCHCFFFRVLTSRVAILAGAI